MNDFLSIAKALSDRSRLRALLALRERELCVCQIVELLGSAPSTVSKHMALLKAARLVEDYKDGRWVYYRRPGKTASPAVRKALAWVDAALVPAPETAADEKRLRGIVRLRREDLCKR